jgi:hypothetical protein
MKNQLSQFVTTRVFCLPAAVFMMIALANISLAQRPGPPPGSHDLKGEMRRTEVRETMLRKTDTGMAAETVDPKRLEAALEKVKEDFKRIQIVRNELVRSLLANQPLDFRFIGERAEELNERAIRLKSYLMPPVAENKEKGQQQPVELKSEEIKPALVRLCNRIVSFIENPILKNPGLTDVEQSAKAGDDLLNIIDLSSNIKRNADRLNKVSK